MLLHDCLLTEYRESFASLSDTERHKVINYIGRIPCIQDAHFSDQQQHTFETLQCSVCEGGEIPDARSSSDLKTHDILVESLRILEKLIQSPILLESRQSRVLAMLALRRYVAHSQSSAILDLQVSVLGMWCLKSLKSSVRELRIAAGYINLPPCWFAGTNFESLAVHFHCSYEVISVTKELCRTTESWP